jgi:exosome complex component CSL4
MVEVKTGDFVLPGDPLATVEEFFPGEGAYEEGGEIYSATVGMVLIDVRTKRISVFARPKTPPVLKSGDIVVGRVEGVKDQSATVFLGALRGKEDRELPAPKLGAIHVSKAHAGYVKDLSRLFKPGDIVRAKVLAAQREPVQLSTVGRDLGVVVALCSRCRTVLDRDGNKLHCPSCGSVEFRKLTNDYRQGVL